MFALKSNQQPVTAIAGAGRGGGGGIINSWVLLVSFVLTQSKTESEHNMCCILIRQGKKAIQEYS